jgi:hypothetical protein
MKKISKTYKKLKIDGQEQEIDCTICYGFDSKLLLEHPNYFTEEEKEHYLYMFVPHQHNSNSWFQKHKNKNQYIFVAFTQEDNFDLLISIVDKIHEKQREAVEILTKDWSEKLEP